MSQLLWEHTEICIKKALATILNGSMTSPFNNAVSTQLFVYILHLSWRAETLMCFCLRELDKGSFLSFSFFWGYILHNGYFHGFSVLPCDIINTCSVCLPSITMVFIIFTKKYCLVDIHERRNICMVNIVKYMFHDPSSYKTREWL